MFLKKRLWHRCSDCEIFKNTFFTENLWTTAPVRLCSNKNTWTTQLLRGRERLVATKKKIHFSYSVSFRRKTRCWKEKAALAANIPLPLNKSWSFGVNCKKCSFSSVWASPNRRRFFFLQITITFSDYEMIPLRNQFLLYWPKQENCIIIATLSQNQR